MSKVSKRKRDMLVGKFCLTFDAEGVLHKQGQILGKMSDSRIGKLRLICCMNPKTQEEPIRREKQNV